MRHAAKNPFPQPAVAVSARHDKVRILFPRDVRQTPAILAGGGQGLNLRGDSMPGQPAPDIGQMPPGPG